MTTELSFEGLLTYFYLNHHKYKRKRFKQMLSQRKNNVVRPLPFVHEAVMELWVGKDVIWSTVESTNDVSAGERRDGQTDAMNLQEENCLCCCLCCSMKCVFFYYHFVLLGRRLLHQSSYPCLTHKKGLSF